MMELKKIQEKIFEAYELLISKDNYLFEVDANERSLTHKLAEYLQAEFPNWNVDCEYNRYGIDVKRLRNFIKKVNSDDTDAVSVYPDIIIHHRGTKDNLVVIEAKKTSSTAEDKDVEKLKAYKKDLSYKIAFKIIFPVKEAFKEIKNISEYIKEVKDEQS